VELHGGTMTLESQVNAGTTVTVVLPADRIFLGAPFSDADSCASMSNNGTRHYGPRDDRSRLRQIADHLMTLEDSAAFSPVSIGAKLLPHLFVLDIEREYRQTHGVATHSPGRDGAR